MPGGAAGRGGGVGGGCKEEQWVKALPSGSSRL